MRRAGSRGGPGLEEELHDGGVSAFTSDIQSCETITSYLVDVSTTIHQQPSYIHMALTVPVPVPVSAPAPERSEKRM